MRIVQVSFPVCGLSATGSQSLAKARKAVARFLNRDRRGAMAVELALITPVLMVVVLSCVDVGRLILAHQKVQLTTNTVGDLISRAEPGEITESGICSSLQAAEHVMSPFQFHSADSVTVASITLKGGESESVSATRTWQATIMGSDMTVCILDENEATLPEIPMGLTTSLEEGETDNIIYTHITFTHEAWFWSFLDRDSTSPIAREALHKPRVAPLTRVFSG